MTKLTNFINGEFVAPQGGQYFENFNPATGEVISLVPDSEAIDIIKAVQSANKAFEKWREVSAKERAQLLNKIADLIEKNADELAKAESQDVGKPVELARAVDIQRTVQNFRFFAA